jgi:hypothetical protein
MVSVSVSDSAWDKLAKEITSPWDWVAAGIGAVGGAAFTMVTHGADLGASIPTGALAGATARKALSASLTRPRLSKSYKAIVGELTLILEQHNDAEHLSSYRDALQSSMRLWSAKGISNEQFAKVLDDTVAEIAAFWQGQQPVAHLLGRGMILRPEDFAGVLKPPP